MSFEVIEKSDFGRSYSFALVDREDVAAFDPPSVTPPVDGISVTGEDSTGAASGLRFTEGAASSLRYLNLNRGWYSELQSLSSLGRLEYLSFRGRCDTVIPFDACPSLWCVYLNYDTKTCRRLFDAALIENLFLDNCTEKALPDVAGLSRVQRLGLMTFATEDLGFLSGMTSLQHLGVGYNRRLVSIGGIDDTAVRSVAIKNCRNIRDWQRLERLTDLEALTIENCGDIESVRFLAALPKLRSLRIFGATRVADDSVAAVQRQIAAAAPGGAV